MIHNGDKVLAMSAWSEGEYEDYLHNLGWLQHKPLPPFPRAGFIGETVYAQEWEKLMQQHDRDGYQAPNAKLASILHDHPTPMTQRQATVCATVICWLGTNCGQAVILGARRLIEKANESRSMAFVMSWAKQNQRHHGVNSGYTAIEHLLAPPDHFGKDWLTGIAGRALLSRPELSVDDYEVIDHLMYWLGDSDGFILKCERRIEELEKWEAERMASQRLALLKR